MTNQHPLTDEIIDEISECYGCHMDREDHRKDMRAAYDKGYDVMLDRVIEWIWSNLNENYADGYEENGELCCYVITDSVVDDLGLALRPQEDQ